LVASLFTISLPLLSKLLAWLLSLDSVSTDGWVSMDPFRFWSRLVSSVADSVGLPSGVFSVGVFGT
jgi:hypothetical protein